MFLSVVTMPTATSSIASIGVWSSPFFTEFVSWIWPVVGIALTIYVIIGLYRTFGGAFSSNIERRVDYLNNKAYPGENRWGVRDGLIYDRKTKNYYK